MDSDLRRIEQRYRVRTRTPSRDPTDCSLYIAGSRGVLRTTDQGASWETIDGQAACTVSGTPDFLFVSALFADWGYRLDLRGSPPTRFDFKFKPDWKGITPFGTASSFDEVNNQWVINAVHYGDGVWRLVLPQ